MDGWIDRLVWILRSLSGATNNTVQSTSPFLYKQRHACVFEVASRVTAGRHRMMTAGNMQAGVGKNDRRPNSHGTVLCLRD